MVSDVLGMGLSHWPALLVEPRYWPNQLSTTARLGLADPERVFQQSTWPDAMLAEWGSDQGVLGALHHAQRLRSGFQRLYAQLTAFHPDLVVIFGDDQTENFLLDGIPPFCVFLAEQFHNRPFVHSGRLYDTATNAFGVSPETPYPLRGHPEAGGQLLQALSQAEFDVAYACQCRYEWGLSHAFVNTTIALQGELQSGPFPYPVLPIHINCHGADLVRTSRLSAAQSDVRGVPPAPSPSRCFQLGQAVGRFFAQSPWRVAIVGSSSWSHAFLTEKHQGLYPDVATDRIRLAQLENGDWRHWDTLSLRELEESGEHEFLNWVAMAGAMAALGHKPTIVDFVESYVFASNKCFAYFSAP